jgi:hypothetical protein
VDDEEASVLRIPEQRRVTRQSEQPQRSRPLFRALAFAPDLRRRAPLEVDELYGLLADVRDDDASVRQLAEPADAAERLRILELHLRDESQRRILRGQGDRERRDERQRDARTDT